MPRVSFIGGSNVVMRGTDDEDRQFVYCPDENVPFILDVTGITPPTPKYYISRQHCDHYIVGYIASGSGTLEINDSAYELQPKDAIILTPKSRHRYWANPSNPFEFLWANFFCDYMDGYLTGIGLRDTPIVHGADCEADLREILRLAKELPNNQHLCFPVMRIVENILISLAEKVHFEKHNLVYSKTAHAIKDYLDDSVYGKADIAEIAANLYISKSTVYREFLKSYGLTPYQYVLNLKIDIAKSMLLRTNNTITEIAAKLAFADEFYFSNLFKKKTGFSPNTFRKYARSGQLPEADNTADKNTPPHATTDNH